MATKTENLDLDIQEQDEFYDVDIFNDNFRKIDKSVAEKVVKNNPIEAKTKTKITYDEKGLVTGGEDLTPDDIPNLHVSKIEGRPPIVYIDGIPIYGSRFFDVDDNGNAILKEDGSGDYLLSVLENGDVILRNIITHTVDNLDSTSASQALSANQGRVLYGWIGKISSLLTNAKNNIVEGLNEVLDNLKTHINNSDNPHAVTKEQVGLGNADNTADIDKEVLSAKKLKIARKINDVLFDGTSDITIEDNTKIPLSQKGAANGVAELDENGFVPSSRLPSYVDDIIESALDAFPTTGENGKIYVDTDTNLTYRWSGSAYVEISKSIALGETASTAYPGNKGKQNADDISGLNSRMTTAENNIDTLQVIRVGDTVLYPTTFVDVTENGEVYLRENGSGEYLLYVTITGIPMLRYIGNKITDDVTGVSYSFTVSNGEAVLKQL